MNAGGGLGLGYVRGTMYAARIEVTSTGPSAEPRFRNVWFMPVWIPIVFGSTERTMTFDIEMSTATFPIIIGTAMIPTSYVVRLNAASPKAPDAIRMKPRIMIGFG